MSRDAFLNRVRGAAAAGRTYRVAPQGDVTDATGYVGGGDDPAARLAAEVEAVGGIAHRVTTIAEAAAVLRGLIADLGAWSALCWRHPLLDRLGLASLLVEHDIEQIDHARLATLPMEEQRRLALAADVGITSCDVAIAETGTLALFSQPGQERIASLLPPIHIAVVEARQIVPDLYDLFAALGGTGNSLPSNVTLITGPSKTGDIELQLTTGVHGPGEWQVIIIAGRSGH